MLKTRGGGGGGGGAHGVGVQVRGAAWHRKGCELRLVERQYTFLGSQPFRQPHYHFSTLAATLACFSFTFIVFNHSCPRHITCAGRLHCW
jgi:hypothetical protein